MPRFFKKVVSETFYSLIGTIVVSGVISSLVWFLGAVLGISFFAFPFLMVWRVIFLCLFVIITVATVAEVVGVLLTVRRYSRKWAVSSEDIWRALMEYRLTEQKDWQNWDAKKFHGWLGARRISQALVDGLMKNLKV